MKTKIKKTMHGGKRKGAGKPAFYAKPMKRRNVILDEETVKILTDLGEGNLSKGVRAAADPWRKPRS